MQLPNLRYLLAPAERLDCVPAASVDLLTAAQSLHWCVQGRMVVEQQSGSAAASARMPLGGQAALG